MQRTFNQRIKNQKIIQEAIESLTTITNIPKEEFLQLMANNLLEQSSPQSNKTKPVYTVEINQLLIEQLNYRNGIHYSVPCNRIIGG